MTDRDKSSKPVTCMDCGAAYTQSIDVVLSREQWLRIHPDDGGVLCAGCLVERAAKLPHVINLTALITFASDFESPDETSECRCGVAPGGGHWADINCQVHGNRGGLPVAGSFEPEKPVPQQPCSICGDLCNVPICARCARLAVKA